MDTKDQMGYISPEIEVYEVMVERGFAIHPSEVRSGTAFTSWIIIGHEHVTPYEAEGLKVVMDE